VRRPSNHPARSVPGSVCRTSKDERGEDREPNGKHIYIPIDSSTTGDGERMAMSREEKKAAIILAAIAATEGLWVVVNARDSRRFIAYMGFSGPSAPLAGWIVAALVFAGFTGLAMRLPSVRANLVRPSVLKLLGLGVAITACFLEEVVFRKLLMDGVQRAGHPVVIQVLASGLLFGAAHGVWGAFRGSVAAAVGATVATGLLGVGLAVTYVASARILAPCVVSHFLINAFAEPGLVLAAVRGEMGGIARRSRLRAG